MHVEPCKDPGIDPASAEGTTTAGPKLAIASERAYQPPMAAAELPPLDHRRPQRRRRASK
jgi:hypothetical protein